MLNNISYIPSYYSNNVFQSNLQTTAPSYQTVSMTSPQTQAFYSIPAITSYYQPPVLAEQYNKQVASNAYSNTVQPAAATSVTPQKKMSPLLENFMKTQRPDGVSQVTLEPQKTSATPYKNHLRTLFQNNEAVIYAMIPRTFNAKDTNGDDIIDGGEESGTFLNAIERLDELVGYGVNTIHMLPIHEPGMEVALGTAGSIYAPKDYLGIDPKLDDPNDPRSVKEEAKQFIDECHKRGIAVMIDLPSCASVDMYKAKPELMATDEKGNPKTPQGWDDIRMFDPWQDEAKRTLNKELVDYHKRVIDLYQELGIDGIRADVARAKPVEFWDEIIPYARSKDPEFAFLAESYTYEDASPMLNMPKDRPEDLLAAGFDSYYGQYHIFNEWKTGKELNDYVIENLEMSKRLPKDKSLIGSFATHDDKSPMTNGGAPYCNMTTGLQMTLPMTNPYFVTGFESGDRYVYKFRDKIARESDTGNLKYFVHNEKLDLFNKSRRPGGENPEIGEFMTAMSKVRKQYNDIITKGSFIPLDEKRGDGEKIISYARSLNGKTLLIVANKDVNAAHKASVTVPGLRPDQQLNDLAPVYTKGDNISAAENRVELELAPASFHVFEINTPNIEKEAKGVYKQNL